MKFEFDSYLHHQKIQTPNKDLSKLSNWTWENRFITAVKEVGIGFDIGLRGNKQEALARELNNNLVQVYWVLGLAYGLSKPW